MQCDQLYRTASGQVGKVKLHFTVDGKAVLRQKGFQLAVDAVSTMGLPDEIKNGQAILVGCMSQTPTQLLKKHGKTFRGAQKKDRIHIRHIKTFIENVSGEKESKLTIAEFLQQRSSHIVLGLAGNHAGRYVSFTKHLGHKLRVAHGYTETDTSHS